jgi:hypothetical protein
MNLGLAPCGTKWFTNRWDGIQGAGQQLTALEVVHRLLAVFTAAPSGARQAMGRDSGLRTMSRLCLYLPLLYVFLYLAFSVA